MCIYIYIYIYYSSYISIFYLPRLTSLALCQTTVSLCCVLIYIITMIILIIIVIIIRLSFFFFLWYFILGGGGVSHFFGAVSDRWRRRDERPRRRRDGRRRGESPRTANLCTKILDFGGFDSSRILILRGEMFMSIGNSPKFRVSKS